MDLSDSIHESARQVPPTGDNNTVPGGPSPFHKEGVIGSMFKADGAIGGTADKIGGPFAKDGAIGKNFNPDGKIGGAMQQTLGKKPED